ncbi:heme-binding protein [Chthoniobacter flavus Ellin428]|uniref:Heme-binding protein n=1 Tax=Chthoniobacter flavus Ellin428 TaxID=497964 RepID=B4CWD0_9BACT|nr:c-type cytochrome [Chthoniobacter flavus]EDY21722.1 heme-binding protein [Chthoniobacter flavus Ellin428]TCO95657.1 putative heme-binding domain-containing protein [Chthoniobacter flavus]
MRLPILSALLLCPILALAETPPASTPGEELTVPPGFKAELLKSASKDEGSWICMAIDSKGRLYISPQGKPPGAGLKKEDTWGGLWRATLDAQGHIAQWDKVPVPVGDGMGMLWAFDSLYVSGDGPEGRGIYRLKDSKGADTLDSWTLFKKVPGGAGEHGAHALVLGPDGKSIYIVHGNATPLIEGTAPDSPFKHYAEDDLLPKVKDPVATFFDKVHSPYGYILKTDENGTKWHLIAGGLRNPYCIAFNADGELFTYDADMEWDVGLPWYRPTRILHIIPGGEYGFREGSAKWPEYYPDSMPAAVNIGLGCPTGVMFGTQSNFPLKYQNAFFVLDWTFGRILAVHFSKDWEYGATNTLPSPYHLTGPARSEDVEEFLKGKAMPVTALEFGKDGAMYFTTGGRNTQAGLYRVSYVGSREGDHASMPSIVREANAVRRKIEAFQTKVDPAIWNPKEFDGQSIWNCMDKRSVAVRTAARVAVENQPVDQWRRQALEQKDPQISLTALLALARVGNKDDQEAVLKALAKMPLDSLSDDLKLQKLRVVEVALARQGRPNSDLVQAEVAEFDKQYPAPSFAENHELCELLVYLGAPDVVGKSLALMDKTKEPAEQIWYALCLREATNWTPAQREHYFAWYSKMQDYPGGNSAKKFLLRIRDLALEKVPEAERPALLALAEKPSDKPKPAFVMPARPFVKNWTFADLEPLLGKVNKGRDFAHGKKVFNEMLCAQCHLFAGGGGLAKGGAVGPDLTAVGSRYSARDIVNKILDPSKSISDQYASFIFTMKDGSIHSGQVADENHYLITLVIDPFNGTKENIPKGNVVSREKSPVSLMPPGMLATLNETEILDLIAYLQSGGNENSPAFSK